MKNTKPFNRRFIIVVLLLTLSLSVFGQSIADKKAQADKQFKEAYELYQQGTAESYLSALEKFQQAGRIYEEIGDKRENTGLSWVWVGFISDRLGRKSDAFRFYDKALKFFQEIKNKNWEAITFNHLGLVYNSIGENQKALDYYNRAIPLSKAVGDKRQEAITINNIGLVYASLGEKQKALDYYNRALPLSKAVGDKQQEATTLNNIGGIYDSFGEKQKALDYYNQVLSLDKETGDKYGEAITLNNIGYIYDSIGEKQTALKYFNQSFPLSKAIGDKGGEGRTLSNIGKVYDSLGEKQKALDYYNRALRLMKEVEDKSNEAIILSNLLEIWRDLKNPRFAIFYGKQSVNFYQELRTNIKGLDKEIQKTYLKSIEKHYRKLADILIAQGRIAEAEQVLEMLKEEEFFSYLRRDANVANKHDTRISFTSSEKQAFADYEKFADDITLVAEELGELEKKKNALGLGETLSTEDQKRFDELKKQYDLAIENFNKFLEELKVKFGKENKKVEQIESGLLALLKRLNQPRTVIISTIVGEDKLNLIVTTSDVQTAHTVNVSASEVNKLVAEFRYAVKNSAIDPRPAGKKLYDTLFPEGLKKDLANIKADTIVWSLDGTLRYVPMAALFDGEKYLVERYTQAVITTASKQRIGEDAKTKRENWLAFGVGVSKSYEKFNALPAVPKELCSVVKDQKQKDFCEKLKTGGVFNGLMYADEDFTAKNFEDNIGKVEVVHIASHFDLKLDDKQSALLLGGGNDRFYSIDRFGKLTANSLQKIELLTLSACNTAMSGGEKSNGLEVEGFAALAQNQGVKSVLATLWAVNDDSTGILMTEFYKILNENPTIGKAEALRKAQLKLIQGEYKTLEESTNRGVETFGQEKSEQQIPFEKDDKAPFKHPYYWSPFVLSGNWK